MVRNLFVREEGNRLVIGSGLFEEWFESEEDIYFGPSLTPWGPVTVRIVRPAGDPLLTVDAHWREDAPRVDIEVPGFAQLVDADCSSAIQLRRDESGLRTRSNAKRGAPSAGAGRPAPQDVNGVPGALGESADLRTPRADAGDEGR
jgi:hypothetical protein